MPTRRSFGLEPDGLALGQYDAVTMALSLIARARTTPEKSIGAFHDTTYKGIAMTYKSNGKGDMAHDADIVCWDGTSRIPSRSRRITAGEDELIHEIAPRSGSRPMAIAATAHQRGCARRCSTLWWRWASSSSINATGAVNFAQGDLVMAGGYAAVMLASWLSLPLGR